MNILVVGSGGEQRNMSFAKQQLKNLLCARNGGPDIAECPSDKP